MKNETIRMQVSLNDCVIGRNNDLVERCSWLHLNKHCHPLWRSTELNSLIKNTWIRDYWNNDCYLGMKN